MKAIVLRACTAGLLPWLLYGVVEFIPAFGFEIFSGSVEMLRWQLPMIGFLFGASASCGLAFGAAGVCLAKIDNDQSMGRHERVVAWGFTDAVNPPRLASAPLGVA